MMNTTATKKPILGGLLGLSLLPPGIALGDLIACAEIEGRNRGRIADGDVSGVCPWINEGIQVLGFGHSIPVPIDPASGLPTGRRQQQPLKILKAVARSSPQLASALANSEQLGMVCR